MAVNGLVFTKFVIDVAKSPQLGKFCFYPYGTDKAGDEGVLPQIPFYGATPPVPDAEILGFIFDGPADKLAKWEAMQAEYLERLKLQKYA